MFLPALIENEVRIIEVNYDNIDIITSIKSYQSITDWTCSFVKVFIEINDILAF